MFIDASAIVAVLNREQGFEGIVRRIEDHVGARYISPLVRFEAVAAVARSRSGQRRPSPPQFEAAERAVAAFCESVEVEEIDITPPIGQGALYAARTYGKFIGHAADLNFGDCYAYACASAYNAQLLYKGDDFAKTDLA